MGEKTGERNSEKRCPFFDVCGAAVIREHNRGENWYQRFCFAGFSRCPHYQYRNCNYKP